MTLREEGFVLADALVGLAIAALVLGFAVAAMQHLGRVQQRLDADRQERRDIVDAVQVLRLLTESVRLPLKTASFDEAFNKQAGVVEFASAYSRLVQGKAATNLRLRTEARDRKLALVLDGDGSDGAARPMVLLNDVQSISIIPAMADRSFVQRHLSLTLGSSPVAAGAVILFPLPQLTRAVCVASPIYRECLP